MSHHSRSAYGSEYERRGRSSSRSRDRVAPPVVYSTTRRSSSVGAGHSGRISPGGYYAVSDTGRVRRHHSSERYRDGGQGHSNYHYITAPSTSASGHHRRSSSASQNAPTYYVAPTSTTHYNRPRSGSESHYYDTRRHHYPDVRVMVRCHSIISNTDTEPSPLQPDHNSERARHRSRSVESRHSTTEHEGFGEKVCHLY
jgi:hypothetical protein